MSLLSIKIINRDPDHLDLALTVVDDNSSDPGSVPPFELKYNGDPRTVQVADSGDGTGLIDWTAFATGRPPNVNTSIAVRDRDEIPVAAAAAAPAPADADG